MTNKYLKICLSSLVVREIRIKINLRFHLTTHNKVQRGCRGKGTLSPSLCNCKPVLPPWKLMWTIIKMLMIYQLRDLAMPLLGTWPKDLTFYSTDACQPYSLLFNSQQLENKNNLQLTDKCTTKIWHMYTMEYYLAIKK